MVKKAATRKTSRMGQTASKQKTTRNTRAPAGRKRAAKREFIDTGTNKRYVRRGIKGRFRESEDVGKSLSADRR
jgi:hypothetical protein